MEKKKKKKRPKKKKKKKRTREKRRSGQKLDKRIKHMVIQERNKKTWRGKGRGSLKGKDLPCIKSHTVVRTLDNSKTRKTPNNRGNQEQRREKLEKRGERNSWET